MDLGGASTKSCRVVFTIEDDDKEDDGENDGDVNEPFNDNKELVAVSVKAGEPTDEVEEEGSLFWWNLKENSVVKTSTVHVLACRDDIDS